MSRLLSVEGLRVDFVRGQRTHAVKGLDFTIEPGETVALVGESGSGKSVTALALLRLLGQGGQIMAGSAHFCRGNASVDLLSLDMKSIRGLRGNEIAMVFQEPMTSLNPVMRIGEQIAEAYLLHERIAHAEALKRAHALLEAVRIPEPGRRLLQYPGDLSGGMRQRVMIAMALACRPKLLIADEPTTALDVTVQAEILELIRVLQRDIDMAVLFITHDMGVVAGIADRVVVMRHGAKVEEGSVGELFRAPREAYTRELLAAVPRLGAGAPALQADAPPPVAQVQGLSKFFPVKAGLLGKTVANVHAVEDVSLTLHAGETLGLVGESGSGKSTLGRLLCRLIDSTQGTIRLNGQDVTRLEGDQMCPHRRDIQMIFQDPYASLNPRLPAWDLVSEPLKVHGSEGPQERRALAAALMERVGLSSSMLDRFAHQFSGGQRQRLCIARALSVRPRVIVADEPVSSLDVSVQAKVLDLLRDLQREHTLAYLFISHDMAVVERVSHRVAVMYLGQIVEIGPTERVLHAPRHPYTQRLLLAVPVPDPSVRRVRALREASELPSPVFPVNFRRPDSQLEEVELGHFVRPGVSMTSDGAYATH